MAGEAFGKRRPPNAGREKQGLGRKVYVFWGFIRCIRRLHSGGPGCLDRWECAQLACVACMTVIGGLEGGSGGMGVISACKSFRAEARVQQHHQGERQAV